MSEAQFGRDFYTRHDRDVLRGLATAQSHIAGNPINSERIRLWTRLNDLRSVRPMVWIDEIPWHEFDDHEELCLHCELAWARSIEQRLRRQIYQWRHFQLDMIVQSSISCPMVWHSTGLGLWPEMEIVRTSESSDIVSREFRPVLCEPKDIEKIQVPTVTIDQEATELQFQAMLDLFDDILPVELVGIKHLWYTPWDYLVQVWGVEQALEDLIDRPEMVHAAVERVVNCCNAELDQFESLGLLSLGSDNTRVGSGGYGYNSSVPSYDSDDQSVRPCDMWGCSNAQIFSAASPDMQWEFAIKHDLPYLNRWGLTYYGCCEPLDRKIEQVRRIPNVRKISMSPFADMGRGADAVGTDYVLSHKPSPALLASDHWSVEASERALVQALDAAKGCHVEVILKDISTIRNDPNRLDEWAQMAMRVVEKCHV